MSGFILINKPVGPTSHDIVDRVRHMTGVKTVGHAGTLDPFASGLLIIGVGREATREFARLVGLDKRYRAVLHFGATSDTDDRTGVISDGHRNSPYPPLFQGRGRIPSPLFKKEGVGGVPFMFSDKDIEQVLKRFTGKIQQLPPVYSAKKIKGKKMYELAREGKTFERQPVEVEIYSIAITKDQKPDLKPSLEFSPVVLGSLSLDIHCSSGTYIRALARDIGAALGCGAYLEELERTAIGPFGLDEAVRADDLNIDNWEKHLISPNQALDRCQSQGGVLGWT